MSDRPSGRAGRSARVPNDQAAGLRRMFATAEPHWLPVLLAGDRTDGDGRWLAALATACVEQGARALVVDAARAQIAAAFGQRVRYDLEHAFRGDCLPREACAPVSADLCILSAARALEKNARTEIGRQRLTAGIRALAGPADCAVLVLPAQQAHLLGVLCGPGEIGDVVIVNHGEKDSRQVAAAMQAALSTADIGAFRLLFQDMDAYRAGSLSSKLAVLATHGVQMSEDGSVNDPRAIRQLVRLVRCRGVPGGRQARGRRGSRALETVF